MTSSPPSKPTLWQTLQPILLREALVVLEGINNLLSQATDQLKVTATKENIPAEQLAAEQSWLGRLKPVLSRLATAWWQAMGWLQQRLPSGLQERYNRTTLTAIALGLLLLLLWLNPLSWFQAPPRPKVNQPRPEPTSTILVQPRRSTVTPPPPTPAPPAPVVLVPAVPEPTPPASPALPTSDTATIRQQLLATCDRYSNALDPTLTLNPSEQRLELMLAAGWYDLSPSKQDQLSQALWQQAHDLGYKTVVIVDTQGQLLVRDPVVGNTAIVVRRKLP